MKYLFGFKLPKDTMEHLEELATLAGEDDVDVYLMNLIESTWIDKTTEDTPSNESY